jgi:replication factor C subunit 1
VQSDADVKGGMAGKMANIVKEMVTNTAVNFDGTPKRQVLIMDEVDGMSSGDRGGVADLMHTIKVCCPCVRAVHFRGGWLTCCIQISKIPIICICNDAWSQKLRSLKNYCLELKFARPTKQMIRGRMMKIAEAEGLLVRQHFIHACASSPF